MYNLGFIAQFEDDAVQFLTTFAHYRHLCAIRLSNTQHAERLFIEKKIHSMTLYLPELHDQANILAQRLHHLFPDIPLIFLFNKFSKLSMAPATQLKKVIFLDKNSESKDLAGVLLKSLFASTPNFRQQRRKPGQYTAKIKLDIGELNASLIDISNGGVALKVVESWFRVGDYLNLELVSKESHRHYSFCGRVVWKNEQACSLGLAFLKNIAA